MNKNPLISVVTCFFNEEQFLVEAIESVLSQTYPHWELWLIDDGSTDGSTQVAKDYALNYPEKIMYYEHKGHRNMGTSVSRNVGIRFANGEWVAFLDGDDVWLPVLLKKMSDLIQKYPVSLVCEASEYWYSWNGAADQDVVKYVGTRQDCLFEPPQLMLDLYPLGKGAAPCLCGMLVNTSILKKYGGFEALFEGMYDDQALLIKLYLNEAVYISSGCHNKYRQRPGSLVHTSRAMGRYHRDRVYFLEWLELYLKRTRFYDKQVKYLLNRAFMPYRYPWIYWIRHRLPAKVVHGLKRLSAKFVYSL